MTAATRRPWAARSSGARSMSGRSPSSSAAIETAARSAAERRPGGRRQRAEDRDERGRQHAGGGDLGAERVQLGVVGKAAAGDEVPHGLERLAAGELGRVVAAVVVEAGLAVDVTDGGVGDGDAVEAGGHVDQGGHAIHRRPRATLAINVDRINVDAVHVTRFDGRHDALRRGRRGRPPARVSSGPRSTPTSAAA